MPPTKSIWRRARSTTKISKTKGYGFGYLCESLSLTPWFFGFGGVTVVCRFPDDVVIVRDLLGLGMC